jgi:hypothetical protein
MRRYVRLIAPAGTDEANIGTTRYRVHDDGTIIVPAEAVFALTHGADFAVAPDDQQPPEGWEPPTN